MGGTNGGRWGRMGAAGLLWAGLTAAGCAPVVRDPFDGAALCEADGSRAGEEVDASRLVELVLRGVDPATRRVTAPALDCTGAQVRWDGPALACEDGALARTALPDRPLEAADVITASVAPGRTLVWITTSRYASGEAMGPVALVDTRPARARVVALGGLRAYPRSARLRLELLGGQRVLVAEGDSCAGADPSSCLRAARLVALRGNRLVAEPVLGEDGQCLQPAWFELARQESRRAEGRPERLELRAQLLFGPTGLQVDEQVIVTEGGGRAGQAPGRVLHRAEASRTVRWVGDRLVTSGGSLWARMAGGR